MNMKHTPWKAMKGPGANNESYEIDDARGYEVASEIQPEYAHLIAAAPELYAELQGVLNALQNYNGSVPVAILRAALEQRIAAALAKAQGK